MPEDSLRDAIGSAARRAFQALQSANPREYFCYFALVTTGDALRPDPGACSLEGLDRTPDRSGAKGMPYDADVLRGSEVDLLCHRHGDGYFRGGRGAVPEPRPIVPYGNRPTGKRSPGSFRRWRMPCVTSIG
ncbi:DUF4303 domain-containing protein [Aureimonas altamirensis]|uniref:DUF4303 domain-containing protein n=1 Tax=Aureimonas altamirensis TaxID=370622 RepID=UPI0009E05091